MTDTERDDLEMRRRAEQQVMYAADPLHELRLKCLARGCSGISGLGRTFRIMDVDRSSSLNLEEFLKGIHDYGLIVPREEGQELFSRFDKDGNGSINFNEFMVALRPPMSDSAIAKIQQVFKKIDKSGDGVCTVADMKGVYNARKHKKYQNGEWTEKEVIEDFLRSFDSKTDPDGKITLDEFIDYYSGVSASIDNDAYFIQMLINAWKV